jgi:hypothetical protein
MKNFVVYMTKPIIVEIEAEDADAAKEKVLGEEDWGGAWDRAEPYAEVFTRYEEAGATIFAKGSWTPTEFLQP